MLKGLTRQKPEWANRCKRLLSQTYQYIISFLQTHLLQVLLSIYIYIYIYIYIDATLIEDKNSLIKSNTDKSASKFSYLIIPLSLINTKTVTIHRSLFLVIFLSDLDQDRPLLNFLARFALPPSPGAPVPPQHPWSPLTFHLKPE